MPGRFFLFLLLIAIFVSGFFIPSIAVKPAFIKDIPVPSGFFRKQFSANSFSYWLQNLPLKQDKIIRKYDGSELINTNYSVLAVVDKACLFKQDLEQCADFCMRLWSDYHKENNKLNELYLFEYSGKKNFFRQELQTYNTFLKESFANANSYSLKTGCKEIGEYNLQPGDLIVQNRNGGIGHVSMIMDVCENKDGLKLFLIGYSFMPAQEFHIEHAAYGYGFKGWFTLPGYYKFLEEKLPYGEPTLRRF